MTVSELVAMCFAKENGLMGVHFENKLAERRKGRPQSDETAYVYLVHQTVKEPFAVDGFKYIERYQRVDDGFFVDQYQFID